MSSDVISATDLARQLAKSIDHVRFTGRDFLIKRGRQTVATLAPPPVAAAPSTELLAALQQFPVLAQEREDMLNDLTHVRAFTAKGSAGELNT